MRGAPRRLIRIGFGGRSEVVFKGFATRTLQLRENGSSLSDGTISPFTILVIAFYKKVQLVGFIQPTAKIVKSFSIICRFAGKNFLLFRMSGKKRLYHRSDFCLGYLPDASAVHQFAGPFHVRRYIMVIFHKPGSLSNRQHNFAGNA